MICLAILPLQSKERMLTPFVAFNSKILTKLCSKNVSPLLPNRYIKLFYGNNKLYKIFVCMDALKATKRYRRGFNIPLNHRLLNPSNKIYRNLRTISRINFSYTGWASNINLGDFCAN